MKLKLLFVLLLQAGLAFSQTPPLIENLFVGTMPVSSPQNDVPMLVSFHFNISEVDNQSVVHVNMKENESSSDLFSTEIHVTEENGTYYIESMSNKVKVESFLKEYKLVNGVKTKVMSYIVNFSVLIPKNDYDKGKLYTLYVTGKNGRSNPVTHRIN